MNIRERLASAISGIQPTCKCHNIGIGNKIIIASNKRFTMPVERYSDSKSPQVPARERFQRNASGRHINKFDNIVVTDRVIARLMKMYAKVLKILLGNSRR